MAEQDAASAEPQGQFFEDMFTDKNATAGDQPQFFEDMFKPRDSGIRIPAMRGTALAPLSHLFSPDHGEAWGDYMRSSPAGRIMWAYVGDRSSWGATPEIDDALRKLGVYKPYADAHEDLHRGFLAGVLHPIITGNQAFSEAILRPVISTGEAALHAFGQIPAAVEQIGREVGLSSSGAREAAGLAEFVVQGAPGVVHLPGPVARSRASAVIGEGEQGYFGTRPPTDAEVAAQTAAEAQVPREPPAQPAPAEPSLVASEKAPTVDDLARQASPELFTKWDNLQARAQDYRRWLGELRDQRDEKLTDEGHADTAEIDRQIKENERKLENAGARNAKRFETALDDLYRRRAELLESAATHDTADMATVRKALQQNDLAMRDLAADVSAAYREAESRLPRTEEVAPEPVRTAEEIRPSASETKAVEPETPVKEISPEAPAPTEPQRPAPDNVATVERLKSIVEDVSGRLEAAGRPVEEARAAAAIIQSYYETRAERMGGKLGSAQELYDRETPDVRIGQSQRTKEMAQDGGAELEQPRRGKINILADGRKIITLFKSADASTFMHESSHAWLEDLLKDAAHEEAPEDLRRDAEAVKRWLGMEGDSPTTRQHEKWARGWERYLMEGRAPSKALADVFAKFREWLTKIYQTVGKLRSPINDDIRDVFDRLIVKNPERTVIAPDLEKGKGISDIHETMAERATPETGERIGDTIHTDLAREAEVKAPEAARELELDPAAENGPGAPERGEADRHEPAAQPDTGPAGRVPELGEIGSGRGEGPAEGLERPAEPVKPRAVGARKSGLYARVPREPRRLGSYLKSLGGLKGDRGDVKATLGDARARPGLINNKSGVALDDAALSAWEAGYFPDFPERPSIDDLLRRLEDDVRGTPQYSDFDRDAVAAYHDALARNHEVDRIANDLGIDQNSMSPDAFWDKVAERMSEEERDREIQSRMDAREEADAAIDSREAQTQPAGEPGPSAGDTGGPERDGRVEAPGEDRQGQRRGGDQSLGGGTAPEAEPAGPSPFGSTDAELVDKAANIRLDLLRSPEDVNEILRQFARANNDFADRRFGDDGRALYNQVLGARHLLKQAGADYLEKARAVSALTDEELAGTMDAEGASVDHPALEAMREAADKLVMIQGELATLTHQWGLAGHAFRDMDGLPSVGKTRTLSQLAQRSRTLSQSELRREAQLVGRLDTPSQQLRFLYQTRQSLYERGRAMYIEYFVNNLISGPITHMAYTIGNAVNAFAKATLETPAAAAISALRGAAPAERVYLGEAVAQMMSWGRGSLDGWDAAARAWREGMAEMLPGEVQPGLLGPEARPGFHAPRPQGAIPGKIGEAIRLPSDAVQAIHSFGRRIGYTQEIWRLAYRDAEARGLEGDARDRHMAAFIANPPEGAMLRATDEATRMVLMNRSKYGSAFWHLKRVMDQNVVAKTVAPFMQIGANLLHEAFMQRSPIGLLDAQIRENLSGRNGAQARDIQTAKMAVGTALSGAVVYAALEGRVSGGGPTDADERRLLMSTGWQPYSVKVNGRWVPYRKYLGPFGLLVGAAANIGEAAEAGHEGDYGGAASALVGGLSEVVADESWFRGVSNFVGAVRNWDTPEGERYLEDLATDFIPYSVGQSQIARMIDPFAREAHSFTDRIKAKIPGLSMTLLPRRDIFGDPLPSRLVTTPTLDKTDRSYQAMEQVGFYPSSVPKTIRGIKLTDQQHDDFARISGRYFRMRLDAMVNQDAWQQIPGHIRYKQIHDALHSAREIARASVMAGARGSDHDIERQAREKKLADQAYRDDEDAEQTPAQRH